MKLITWNIQWGRGIDEKVDLERIVQTARAIADFDVICLQEVADNFPDPGLAGNDDGDQFARLAALLPGYHAIAGHGVDFAGDDRRRRRFGNLILTRYTVVAARRHALPWPPDPAFESMPRVAVEVTLRTPIGPIRITTAHLEYYSDLQRRAQAARLRELHEEACARAARPAPENHVGGPFDTIPQTASAILTGDFNLPPQNTAYDDIQRPSAVGKAYRDAWRIANGNRPHTPTFCVHSQAYSKTPYCCDFVFVSEPLFSRVRSVSVDSETQASDHQPVLLELDDR